MDFALNRLQGLICHKTQTTDQPTMVANREKFLESSVYSALNCYAFTLCTRNISGCSRCIMVHVHQCGFQIANGLKKFITCQRTTYPDTTDHSGYLPWRQLLQSGDVRATKRHAPKYRENFDSVQYLVTFRDNSTIFPNWKTSSQRTCCHFLGREFRQLLSHSS